MEIKNIILDLDETLISSKTKKELKETPYKYFKIGEGEDELYVFIRPHVQIFLKWLLDNYNVSVWSAGSKLYVIDIVEKLFGDRIKELDLILFANHCKKCKVSNRPKDLSKLFFKNKDLKDKYTEENTMIIDDNENVYKTQPKNTIVIKPFDANDNIEDNELLRIKKLLSKN